MNAIEVDELKQHNAEGAALTISSPDAASGAVKEEKSPTMVKHPDEFYNDLVPECFVGVGKDAEGELMYLARGKETAVEVTVPAHIARVKWPKMIIEFLESVIVWRTSSETEIKGKSKS